MHSTLFEKTVFFFLILMTFGTLNAVGSTGTVRYVSTNGADSATGTEDFPFRTIQKAADVSVPGDRIIVTQGVYNEFLTIKNSGTFHAPIVFEGQRGPGGEYKTIIDPSVPVTGWKLAPEIGVGVYKTTRIGFDPKEITVDNKRIGRINNSHMQNGTGFEYLTKRSDAQVFLPDLKISVFYWDGVEALYGFLDGVTYIRFRDSDNPNKKNIKAAPIGNAITLSNKTYITIKNFLIRGARIAVKIAGNQSLYNIIENNYLMNGGSRIRLYNGAAYNVIRNNELTMNYLGSNFLGAGSGGEEYAHFIKRHVYKEFKHTVSGNSTSDDVGIAIVNAGSNNEIYNNHIFGGLRGITGWVGNTDNPTKGLKIHDNIIHNMSSVGITSYKGMLDSEYYDNLIYDCNINIRLHEVVQPADLGRRVFIYKNRFWNPRGVGYHFYASSSTIMNPDKYPEYYIFHNSFSGGAVFMGIMNNVTKSGGMPNTHIINNIISSRHSYSAGLISLVKENQFGIFDYNWIGGVYPKDISLALFSDNNIFENGEYFWDPDKVPDFNVWKNRVSVVNSGLALSSPRIFNGSTFNTLPGMQEGYFSGAGPSLGAIQFKNISKPSNFRLTRF